MNSTDDSSPLKALLVLAFGALCVSFAAIFVKLLGRDVLGPTAIGFWRVLFGSAILFTWVILKGYSPKMPASIMGFAVLAGFIFFLDLFFWHRSIIFSGAGMATILANTQVFVVSVLGFVLFKERLSLVFVLAALAAFVGVVLLIGVGSEVEFSTTYLNGVIFGLLTGVVYGAYILTLKKTGHRKECPSFLTVMAWTSLFTAFFCGVSMLIESDPLRAAGFVFDFHTVIAGARGTGCGVVCDIDDASKASGGAECFNSFASAGACDRMGGAVFQ